MTMRLLFMGTPEFAVPSLRGLIAKGEQIVGVVTQPDRPKGRGGVVTAPPVKETAKIHQIPVYQPDKVRRPDFVKTIEGLNPDLIVVVAFGQILPGTLLRIPKGGSINVHASLLPKYRGAAPIACSILEGEVETGVTTMMMDEGMDTGPILVQRKTEIKPGETTSQLGDRLAVLGAELLLETVDQLVSGSLKPIPQDSEYATYAPLLRKEDGLIDWGKEAVDIERQVRAMAPWPSAYTFYQGERLRFWEVKVECNTLETKPGRPGEILRAEGPTLEVATGKGYIKVNILQAENRKRMSSRAFLAGYRMEKGSFLSSLGGRST